MLRAQIAGRTSRVLTQAVGLGYAVGRATYEWLKGWIPTHVMSVWHLDDKDHTFTNIYSATMNGLSWTRGHADTIFVPPSGFYLIDVWNVVERRRNRYFLSAAQLSNALQLKGLQSWWAMSDFGICTLLNSHMILASADKMRVFSVHIDGKDVTDVLNPFRTSLVLDDNLTATAVCDLYHHLSRQSFEKEDGEHSVVITDYDFRETSFNGNDLLFPREAK